MIEKSNNFTTNRKNKMKAYFLALITLFISTWAMAQQLASDPQSDALAHKKKHRHEKPTKPPGCYIETSTGINNPSGVLGLDFNICLAKHVTLDAGIGTSTWGNKLFVGSKYYLKSPHRGFAFGGGLTFNSGQENRDARAQTINGKVPVVITFKAQPNVFVAAYHYWTLGRKYNRFFTELGWSVPLHSPQIHEVSGPPLTQDGRNRMDLRAPGGLMIGFGFSFALYSI